MYDFKNKNLSKAIVDAQEIVSGLKGYGVNVGEEMIIDSISKLLDLLNLQANSK